MSTFEICWRWFLGKWPEEYLPELPTRFVDQLTDMGPLHTQEMTVRGQHFTIVRTDVFDSLLKQANWRRKLADEPGGE